MGTTGGNRVEMAVQRGVLKALCRAGLLTEDRFCRALEALRGREESR